MELASKSVQSDFLTCFLCSEFYEEPKTLKCLHSFCKKCILENIQQQIANITKKCPVCQDTFDENLQDKNTNIFLQNRVKFFKERANNLSNPNCAVCRLKLQKNKMAVAQCISCLDFLCKVCSDIHNMTTLTINHQVMSLTEIKTGKYDDVIFTVRFQAFCPEHEDEEVRFYCIPCHTLTCVHCLILGHKGHEFKALDILKEDKVKSAKKVFYKLNEKLDKLIRSKDSMISEQDQLKTQKTTIESEITKKSSEAVSRIDKGRNKMLKDLENVYLPKSKNLNFMVEKMAARCETIKQTLQYAEFMFKGTNAEIILSLDELLKRLENLAEDNEKFEYPNLNKEMSNIALKITDPLKLLLVNADSFSKEMEKKWASPQDDNSSDFVYSYDDKATQTLEVDFENTQKRKYKINVIKRRSLSADDDNNEPYFTGVAWIDENNFIAVDAKNAKLKKYSLLSGKIVKAVKTFAPLAVSVWAEGVACLSKDNKMTTFSGDLIPQQTFPQVSSLCSSLPFVNQLTWIENMTIFIKRNDTPIIIPVKSASAGYFRYACCLPDGSFAISDKANTCVHLVDACGKIFKTLCCDPGAISFDKYYNIFISCFHKALIGVYNIEGTHITDLYISERPRSISILHDKLLVAVEHGCKISVYDITYK